MSDDLASGAASPSAVPGLRAAGAPPNFFTRAFLALCIVALILGVARRLTVGWEASLWLDEAFTGAIAIGGSFGGLVRDCLSEVSGPVYYSLMWVWAKLFGAGDVSLRVPSVIFAIAAPLVLLAWGHRDRSTRWLWATFAALWLPGAYFATEARAYALLFLLAAIQLVLFARLLEAPTLRKAFAWSAVSVLLTLTHYHSLVVTGLQGLTFLLLCKGEAVRRWPAAFLFVPAGAWMVFHLPVLFRFANPEIAWQSRLGPLEAIGQFDELLGLGRLSHLLAAGIAATIAFDIYRRHRNGAPSPYSRIDVACVAPSLLAAAIVIGMGMVTPSFTTRYLIPFVPGVLLGVALWTRRWGAHLRPLPWLVVILFSLLWARDFARRAADPKFDIRRGYNWDEASQYLRAAGVERTVFLWDNPTAALFPPGPGLLGRVGAFFFHRAGEPVIGEGVHASGGEQAIARALLKAAAKTPALRVGTLLVGGAVNLARYEHGWTCRRFGGPDAAYYADVHVMACHRPALATDRKILL